MNKYDDIINILHFEPKHKRMSTYERAAQFAPFAALVGYSDEINETSRLTENEKFIDENYKDILNRKIEIIKKKLTDKPKIVVTYFVPDKSKSGGKYVKYEGVLKKIKYIEHKLIFIDDTEIDINYVKDIDSDIISYY